MAIFASASESFSKSNINCTIQESLTRYNDVAQAAKEHSLPVRGYAFPLYTLWQHHNYHIIIITITIHGITSVLILD